MWCITIPYPNSGQNYHWGQGWHPHQDSACHLGLGLGFHLDLGVTWNQSDALTTVITACVASLIAVLITTSGGADNWRNLVNAG